MSTDTKLSHNPDAVAWAKEFKKTFPESDEELMIGWFANAMMAMHDHLMSKYQAWNTRPAPDVGELKRILHRAVVDIWPVETRPSADEFASVLFARVTALQHTRPAPDGLVAKALRRIRDRAQELRNGTDDWFELTEFALIANEALTALQHTSDALQSGETIATDKDRENSVGAPATEDEFKGTIVEELPTSGYAETVEGAPDASEAAALAQAYIDALAAFRPWEETESCTKRDELLRAVVKARAKLAAAIGPLMEEQGSECAARESEETADATATDPKQELWDNIAEEIKDLEATQPSADVVEAAFKEGFNSGKFAGYGNYNPLAMEEAWDNSSAKADIAASPQAEPVAYDAGFLGDGGGGDVNWWQNYIREELERAHEYYAGQWPLYTSPPFPDPKTLEACAKHLEKRANEWRKAAQNGCVRLETTPQQADRLGAECEAMAWAIRNMETGDE